MWLLNQAIGRLCRISHTKVVYLLRILNGYENIDRTFLFSKIEN